jgi:hypothetical protein
MMQAGTDRPRFRQDLLAEAVDEQGAKYIDVMDPESGNVFRFYEVEFSIACAMDGERDVAGLVKWARDELGVTPTDREVRTVIATLGDLGYLEMIAASKAAAADVPAPQPTAPEDLASDTVVEARPPSTPVPSRPAAQAAKPAARTPGVAAAPPAVSEVSIDLSEHLAVGKEDVQEALRQSRVMSAVDAPPELAEPRPAATTQPLRPLQRQTPQPQRQAAATTPAKQPERPIEAKQPERLVERPVETKQPERLVEQPTPVPVEAKQPERPVERPTPVPVEAKQPERPVERPEAKKPAVELPKVPEKQPVPATEPTTGRMSPAVIVVLILVVLGLGAFLLWKFVLGSSGEASTSSSVTPAPVTPQPEAPAAPASPVKWATAKIEMTSGRPKTILAFFPGVIEWIEASGKEAKSGDVIMKLAGYRPLERQVTALQKEVEKLQAEMQAAYKARDDAPQGDEAAAKKVQARIEAAEKAYNPKSDLLQKKTDQLEPYYVRLINDGTLTITRKAGERIPENTPIATIVSPPAPSATFTIPPDVKVEIGTMTSLKLGEKLLTCEVADWEPEKVRIGCPEEPAAVEGATVAWQLP